MPRVIIFEQPERKFDLTDLKRFGEIEVLYLAGDRAPHPFRKKEFDKEIGDVLDRIEYDADRDYIALVGKTTKFMYLALNIVARYGRAKLLQYNATNETYFVQHIGDKDASPHSSRRSSANDTSHVEDVE